MDEHVMAFEGNGSQEFLSLINAEVDKVEPASSTPPIPPDEQKSPPMPLLSLSSSSEIPKEVNHLKAETFSEPTLPIDGLSESVQEYIRTVADSYGCPQEFVVVACFITAGIAAGKKVQLVTNPYTNYPCDFFSMVGKPAVTRRGRSKRSPSPFVNKTKSTLPNMQRRKLHTTNVNVMIETTAVSSRCFISEWLVTVPRSHVMPCWHKAT